MILIVCRAPLDNIIAASDGGVYSSNTQGSSWSNLNTNLTITQFYSVSADPNNTDNILGGTQDNALQRKLPNYSHQWVSDRGIDGEIGTVTFSPLNPNNVLAQVANSGSLYYSSNNGNTFVNSTILSNVSWILPIVWHPTDPNVVYTAGFLSSGSRQIILISQNSGKTWNSIFSDFPIHNLLNKWQSALQILLFYLLPLGSFSFWPWSWSYQALYKSVNGGVNWTNLNVMQDDSPKIPKRYISKIGINPLNESDIFITLSGFGGGHVWRSVDGGNLWKDFSGNLPNVPVNDIVVYNDPIIGAPYCMVATDCGVFISQDLTNGKWMEIALGLPNSIVLKLDYKPNTLLLRAATHGRGIWEVNLGTAKPTGKNPYDNIKRYLLYQNLPNPFNPTTKIKYEIPIDESVSLKIYDGIGREVASPVNNEYKKAGSYTVEWNASKISSGVYFYKLQAGDFMNVKRMVLIK